MTIYLRGTVEESAEILIKEVLDAAPDSTFENVLGLPPEPQPEQSINKTLLGKVLLEVAKAVAQKKTIVGIIKHVRDAEATLGVQLNHDDVRRMKKMILDEYAERFLTPEV